MPGYQYTIIIGHVGREPELRYTQSGAAVCDFSVAVARKWTQDGQKREETTWFRVSAWRGLAETVSQYVHKGQQIMVTGRVEADAYIGKDGEAHATLELTAQNVQFLGKRGESTDMQDAPRPGGGYERQAAPKNDLPF